MATKKKAVKKETKPVAPVIKRAPEGFINVEVLKDHEGFKKGQVLVVAERKGRDSARLIRKGFIKVI